MPKTRTTLPHPVIKILSDLNLLPEKGEDVNEKSYLRALMDGVNILSIESLSRPGRSDPRIKILQDEVKRVRAADKEREKVVPKIKKTKITGAAFKKGTSQESVENIQANNEVTSLAIREPRPDVTSKDITPVTEEEEPKKAEVKTSSVGEGLKNILNSIAGTTESIKNILIGQQEVDRDAAKDAARETENVQRAGQEKKLETKLFDGVKKVGEKVLKPVQGLFQKIWGFVKKVLLADIVRRLFNWLSDDNNKKKVGSIFRFVKDFWPALLTGFLLFGTGIGSLITGTVAAIGGFIPVLVGMLPKLLAFLASPIGLAVLGTAAVVGGGMWVANKMKGDGDDKKIEGGGEEKSPNEDKTIGEGGKIDTGKFLNMPTPTENGEASQKFSNFNKGGSVPGQGNTDTVPAMLTPGEFVLTKEATEKYGTDTLESMNAAAATGKDETSGTGRLIGSTIGGLSGAVVGFFADTPVSPAADIALGMAGSVAGGEIGDNIERKLTGKGNSATNATQSFRNGGLVQYLNNGGKVQETSWGWNANTRNGRVVSGNVSQEQYDNEMRINKLEDEISEMEFYAETPAEKKELIELKTEAAKLGSMFYSEYLPGSEHYDLVIQEKIDAGMISDSAGKRLMKMQKSIQQPQTNVMQNATLKRGQVVSGNMNQSDAEKLKQQIALEDAEFDAIQIYGFDSPEHNEIKKQKLILSGTPAEAIYTDKNGEVKVRGYSTVDGQTTVYDGKNKKSKKGKKGKKGKSGLGRLIGGAADFLTGNLTDFDGKGGKTFGASRILAGAADALTGNRWDFDKHGKPAKVAKSKPKHTEIAPPSISSRGSGSKPGVTAINAGGVGPTIDATNDTPIPEVPVFSAVSMRSPDKIKTLGIMV